MYINFLTGNVFSGIFGGVPAIERSVVSGNGNWDLKIISAIARCPV